MDSEEKTIALWHAVPEDVRVRIDEQVCRSHMIQAAQVFREDSGIRPRPNLHSTMDLLDYRMAALREQGRLKDS